MDALTYADLMLCGNYVAGGVCRRELAAPADKKGSLYWKIVLQLIEARHWALTRDPAKALPMLRCAPCYSLTQSKSPSSFRFVRACQHRCCAREIRGERNMSCFSKARYSICHTAIQLRARRTPSRLR